IDAEREAKEIGRQTANFSKVHVVTQGETISLIAATYYDDPQVWRPIAIMNNLVDPRDLLAGQSLRIPALPFIDPESGEGLRWHVCLSDVRTGFQIADQRLRHAGGAEVDGDERALPGRIERRGSR